MDRQGGMRRQDVARRTRAHARMAVRVRRRRNRRRGGQLRSPPSRARRFPSTSGRAREPKPEEPTAPGRRPAGYAPASSSPPPSPTRRRAARPTAPAGRARAGHEVHGAHVWASTRVLLRASPHILHLHVLVLVLVLAIVVLCQAADRERRGRGHARPPDPERCAPCSSS